MATNAEKALEDIQNMPIDSVSAGNDGTKSTLATDASLLRIKVNTAMFVVERLGGEDWALSRTSYAKKIKHPVNRISDPVLHSPTEPLISKEFEHAT